jgi:simple sugar transport system substrate-binding protein
MRKNLMFAALLAMAFVLVFSACGQAPVTTAVPPTQAPATQAPATEAPTATVAPTAAPFVFGILLVGPHNDNGWSQATYDGALYAEANIPNSKLLYLENVYSNSPTYPGQTASQLAESLVSQGAQLVIFNSDDMKDESNKFAAAHPEVKVLMLSGDQVWQDGKAYTATPNIINIMGRMEYMKMIAGCAAALTTTTGKIGFLGPLINDETRRLAASAFLGAKYCWTNVLNKDAADLTFTVTWIGFWFNIPGFTSDPTQVADNFFANDYDVVISGIDTPEALTEAKKAHDAGKNVFALAYDYKSNCDVAPEVCLGVPYFNWGPAIKKNIMTAVDGSWQSHFEWNDPDWTDLANPDTGAVGFNKGQGLSADNATKLDAFIAQLAGGLNLWTGPLNLQDKTSYLADGVAATDQQIWYLPQLLEGMEGDSVAK